MPSRKFYPDPPIHVIASSLGNPEVDLGMQNLNPEVDLGMQNLYPEVDLGMQNLYPGVDLGMKKVKASGLAFEKQKCEVNFGCQTFRLQITTHCL